MTGAAHNSGGRRRSSEYVRHGDWRHKCVTLFVLQDMQPLAWQFQSSSDSSERTDSGWRPW